MPDLLQRSATRVPKPTPHPPSAAGKERKLLPPDLGAILEFTAGEEKGRQVPLAYTRTVIGRKFGDILVRDLKVSSTHVAVEFRSGRFHVIDLGSSNGTYVAGHAVKDALVEMGQEIRFGTSAFVVHLDPEKAAKLKPDQPLYTGYEQGGLTHLLEKEFRREGGSVSGKITSHSIQAPVEMTFELEVAIGPDRGKKFALDRDGMVIGRIDADIILADPDISRKHAFVEIEEGRKALVRDLASTNGTYVNDRRIMNSVLAEGDRIRVGRSVLVFHARNKV